MHLYPKLGAPFSKSEWKLLEAIGKFLELFEPITRESSSASVPTISTVVPAYFHLHDCLEDFKKAEQTPIRSAASKSLEKLQKYVRLITNHYFFASFLDPRLKYKYFENLVENPKKIMDK
jgi:hypothetical protein